MNHTHLFNYDINLNNSFRIGIVINIVFIVIEVLYGYFSNSMALIADAGHNTSDVLALIFSWAAVNISRRKPTLKFTYGFRRSTILIAVFNTILLLAAMIFILFETIRKLNNPLPIKTNSVIIVAFIGILVNGITALLFMKGKSRDLNIKSAFIHFVADTLVSFGVVVAGVIIAFTGLVWVDSLVSFLIISVILYNVYHLLKDSLNLALDAVPENINIKDVQKYFLSIKEVSSVHDLHIWALGTTDTALTVHLSTNQQTDITFITTIQHQLNEKFNIKHATIQVEYGDGKMECENNCN